MPLNGPWVVVVLAPSYCEELDVVKKLFLSDVVVVEVVVVADVSAVLVVVVLPEEPVELDVCEDELVLEVADD